MLGSVVYRTTDCMCYFAVVTFLSAVDDVENISKTTLVFFFPDGYFIVLLNIDIILQHRLVEELEPPTYKI